MRLAFFFLSVLASAFAQASNAAVDQALERVILREKSFLDRMRKAAPLVETYIQEAADGVEPETPMGARPIKDHYFLGRIHVGSELTYEPLVARTDAPPPSKRSLLPRINVSRPQARLSFVPRGFAQMAFPDLQAFDRKTYRFEYVQREFLGEIRCLVFDVAPRVASEAGRFVGRLWVEDQDFAIVRFDGTYVPAAALKGAPPEHYFHFDSWRVNVAPGEWAPAQIYVEEAGAGSGGEKGAPRFKAQTRLWAFAAGSANKLEELTKILIEGESGLKDQDPPKDESPLESQRSWEHQAEENLLSRFEKGGFLAPPGPVDEVLNTVVENLIASANLNVEARCRVLLTTPIETFSIGHTIVISRGLIDVLPDEASLALMLAGELAHIALGHRTPTQFAFHNQTMLSDVELLQRARLERSPQEMLEASAKTIEIMRASPYKKTANAGLFLKALNSRSASLPRLLASNIGNQVANAEAISRLAEFTSSAPALEEDKVEQIAALPLGSRIKLDPWTSRIVLVKTKPLSLLSAREKMPFEVTPFALYLTRVEPH
jgi:hypothetical protein